MSPRATMPSEECPYCECDVYYSQSQGTLVRTYICHHPENEGCWCTHSFSDTTPCELCPQEEEEKAPAEADTAGA